MAWTNEQRIAAGGVALLLVGGGYWAFNNSKTGCEMTAAALPVIAAGVSKGKSATAIVAAAGGSVFVNDKCNAMVDDMIKKPNSAVTPTIIGGGSPQPVTIDLNSLYASTSRPTCLDWRAEVLRTECFSGRLGPPAIR